MTLLSHKKTVLCPYCRGLCHHFISAKDINQKISNLIFNLYRCSTCGLLHVINPPEDLTPFYARNYHPTPKDREELQSHLATHKFKIDLVKRFRKSGGLLEIGPSIGQFCELAQESKFNVSAIEMDCSCVKFLRLHLGINVTHSDNPYSVLLKENSEYDVICLWHSLEHLKEPWKVLEQSVVRLKPGGILVVAAPNPLSRQAKMMGSSWPHHDLPRHLFGIPIPWLKKWGREQGLNELLVTTRDQGSLHFNRFSYAKKASQLASNSRLASIFWVLGLKLGAIMAPWEDKEGEGACYVMVLENPLQP